MATSYYTATARDSRTLELPEEAQTLGLQPGDEVEIVVRHKTGEIQTAANDEEQARLRTVLAQLYAEADAAERTPETPSNPQKAQIAERIVEKHRSMGMKL